MARVTLKKQPMVKKSHKIAMGVGDLGNCLVGNTFATFILFFGTTVMGVDGILMGLAIAAGTFWDAITDPIVGYFSDNSKNKFFGRRHGYILIGIFGLAIVNILIWAVPREWNDYLKAIYFAVTFILLKTFHTLYFTPNSALSMEISNNYDERSTIQAYKSVFYIIGMLLPAILMGFFQRPTELYPEGRFNPQSYLNLAYVASACTVLFGLYMFMTTYSHVPRLKVSYISNKKENKRLIDIFKAFFASLKNKNLSSVVIGYSVAMMAATFLTALGLHTFTFTFKTTSTEMYLLMGSLFAMTIISQPIWLYLSKKYSKKRALLMGLYLALVGCFLIFVLFFTRDYVNALLENNKIALLFMAIPLMVAGLGVGVLFSMPLALVGDTVIMTKAETNEEKAGTYAGFMTFSYKLSQALSQIIIGVMLDIIGFQGKSATQPRNVETALGWLFCIGVTVSIIGGILIFSKYNLNKEDVNAVMEKDDA